MVYSVNCFNYFLSWLILEKEIWVFFNSICIYFLFLENLLSFLFKISEFINISNIGVSLMNVCRLILFLIISTWFFRTSIEEYFLFSPKSRYKRIGVLVFLAVIAQMVIYGIK